MAAWSVVAVVVGSILIFGRDILVPLAVAFIIWHLINALSRSYRRLRVGGWQLPDNLCLGMALLTIAAAIYIIVLIAAGNVAQVAEAAPSYQANIDKILPAMLKFFGLDGLPTVSQALSQIDVPALIRSLAGAITTLAGSVGLIAIYILFFILEQRSFDDKIAALFPDPNRADRIRGILADIESKIEAYLRIKTFVSLLTAALCYLVLWYFGVDYQGFWALVVFLFNFIPNVGSFLAVMFPVVLTLLQFADFLTTAIVLVLLSAVQLAIGNFVEPRLMGSQLNLSPLVIIISLAFWGSIWGLPGMFLCVPLTMIFTIVCAHFELTRPIAILLSGSGKID
ncbi:MAG: AI-2E family transporter [Geminicoccaceae bacterium]